MNPSTPVFAPTRWSLVERARGSTPEAQLALSELCEAYWRPVFEVLRRRGNDEEFARESTQEFFAHVLTGGRLEKADRTKGRFRSYLLGALRHFEADRRERDLRHKRGGGITVESLSAEGVMEPVGQEGDPVWFDREWAMTIVERALKVVEVEDSKAGRSIQFERLKATLVGGNLPSSSDLARELGITEGALKVAVHRLRGRFREAVRTEIAQTLGVDEDVETELRYLVEVLARG